MDHKAWLGHAWASWHKGDPQGVSRDGKNEMSPHPTPPRNRWGGLSPHKEEGLGAWPSAAAEAWAGLGVPTRALSIDVFPSDHWFPGAAAEQLCKPPTEMCAAWIKKANDSLIPQPQCVYRPRTLCP